MSRILLLLGQPEITWRVFAQTRSGSTFEMNNYDEIQFDGNNFGDKIFTGQFQDSTHVIDSTGVHKCTSDHAHNVKFVSNTTASIDNAASTTLPIGIANCPMRMTMNSLASVATSQTKFYGYDGVNDTSVIPNANFKAVEGGNHIIWTTPNGSGNALVLADQGASTSHTFYLAFSFSPSILGLVTGKIKLSLTYV